MRKVPARGIDLGTTNTIVAAVNSAGHSEVLRTREGDSLIPSVVLLSDDRVIVGREALLRGRAHPDRLAACVKQQLGQPYYSQRLGGDLFPPEVLEACILQSVKQQWFAENETYDTAIAVPAHFNETQRHAVIMAAGMAGINLIDLVPEPIAATLAFTEHAPELDAILPPLADPTQLVLVYDLGGYTFDASVVRLRPGKVELLATVRDSHLGGHDWDLRLADFLVEPFIRKNGLDPRNDPAQLDLLLQRAANIKHNLGIRSHSTQNLSLAGQVEQRTVTREEFQRFTADLVDRTITHCEKVLYDAQIKWSDLRRVLLVGGASRMPIIKRRLTKLADRSPDDHVSPDEAVARGAALYAAALRQGRAAPPPLQLLSISTHSLGIEGTDQSSGKRINKVLIPKGTPLPETVTREFVSGNKPGQSIVFKVMEGEDGDPARCVTIGRVVIGDLPPDLSDQWPIDVTFSFSVSGRLTVDARIRYTERHVQLVTVRLGGVSQFRVARWKEALASQGGLAALRQALAWERAAPPIALAGAEQLEPQPQPPETNTVLDFLKRLMPFVFRQSGVEEPTPSPATDTTTALPTNATTKE